MKQQELIKYLAEIIAKAKKRHPIRAGINGVDASGKTILANALNDISLDNSFTSRKFNQKK